MANSRHPLDIEIDQMEDTRGTMLRLFIADGVLCERERTVLSLFDDHLHDIEDYRLREVAADSFKRNGPGRVTHDRFAEAGFGLVDLVAHREPANVVKFPTHRPTG